MIVVANMSPICYLLLIGCPDVFPMLFGRVTIQQAVCDELGAEGAPAVVQAWIAQPPGWLEVQRVAIGLDPPLNRLHQGEREAIVLAERLGADLILLDER
jgi:predicted nucleic acid-binding protein